MGYGSCKCGASFFTFCHTFWKCIEKWRACRDVFTRVGCPLELMHTQKKDCGIVKELRLAEMYLYQRCMKEKANQIRSDWKIVLKYLLNRKVAFVDLITKAYAACTFFPFFVFARDLILEDVFLWIKGYVEWEGTKMAVNRGSIWLTGYRRILTNYV